MITISREWVIMKGSGDEVGVVGVEDSAVDVGLWGRGNKQVGSTGVTLGCKGGGRWEGLVLMNRNLGQVS